MTPERIFETEKNKTFLKNHPDILTSIANYYADYKHPAYANTDVEAGLYLNGFWAREEDLFCEQFHRASLKEKIALAEKSTHPQLKILAWRILSRHFAGDLTKEQLADFDHYLQRINSLDQAEWVVDYQGQRKVNAVLALNEVAELRQRSGWSEEDLMLLVDLERYLQGPALLVK